MQRVVVASTGEAARMAKENKDIYCIANSYAIDLLTKYPCRQYSGQVDNKTRFLVIGKMIEIAGEKNKTSIMININDKPGSLLKILQPFADLDINMTRIETRPSRNNIFHHTFFIDFEGYYEEDTQSKAFEQLESISEELRVIGSYPVLK